MYDVRDVEESMGRGPTGWRIGALEGRQFGWRRRRGGEEECREGKRGMLKENGMEEEVEAA